jgi:N-acetylglucosamine kinase-like BadF-type ATPase
MAETELLLGVNGADSTEAVIATMDGVILGRGLGPASNHHRVGIERAQEALRTTIERAVAQVRLRGGWRAGAPSDAAASPIDEMGIRAACFGLSGVDEPRDQEAFNAWIPTLGQRIKYIVCNDSELTLNGGTPDGCGIALISGTGSICIGRCGGARIVRVGGWGHLIGDEGSGFSMAIEALHLATQAADGRGGAKALLDIATEYWKLTEPRALLGVVYRRETTPEELAGFAGHVLELASRNDPHAREIVNRAAKALAVHVDTVAKTLGMKEPPLALSGRMMRLTFKRAILASVSVPLGPVSLVSDSAQCAIAAARRLLTRES